MAREEMNITAKYLKLDIAVPGVSIVKVKNIAQVRCTVWQHAALEGQTKVYMYTFEV